MKNHIGTGLRVILFLALTMSAPAKAAATLQIDEGILTGAEGVLVDGQSYDVQFSYGSCASVANGCTPDSMIFQTSDAALLASSALLEQVFIGIYGNTTALVKGCPSESYCDIYTPYSSGAHSSIYHPGDLLNAYAHIEDSAVVFGGNRSGIGTGKGADFSAVWANWQVSAVPEVSNRLMFLMGIFMMAAGLLKGGRRSMKGVKRSAV